MTLMRYVTDFADQAVILPVFALVAAALALSGWWRGAVAWVCVIGLTLLAVLASKVLMFACGSPWTDGAFRSPSGHTAAAAAVYGGLAAIVVRRSGGSVLWAVAASAPVALLVGASRIALDLHTGPDVMVGGLLGTAGAVGLAWLAGTPPPRLRFSRLGLAALAVALALHGAEVSAETLIQDAAAWLAPSLGCAA